MSEPENRPPAWEPLTPPGVAAFAHATAGRLALVQFIIALAVAVSVVWFLYDAWCPTIDDAIERLPEQGEIRLGKLNWPGDSPQLLAEGTFLAFTVDLEHASDLLSPAHVQVEFGRDTYLIHSLLGYTESRYPDKWIVSFNRKELKPKWGAWQPALLGITGLGVIASLMVLWYALATIYTLPVWLVAFFANRDLKLPESCRLAGAALMPGAFLMAAGILFYDLGLLDLVGLGFVTIGHLVLGWIYLIVTPLFLPKATAAAPRKNPFANSDQR